MYNKTLAVVKVILLFTKHKQKNVYLIIAVNRIVIK